MLHRPLNQTLGNSSEIVWGLTIFPDLPFWQLLYCWFACDVMVAMLLVKSKSTSLPLGTKPYFSCKFFEKKIVLTTNIAALSRGCKPRINHVFFNYQSWVITQTWGKYEIDFHSLYLWDVWLVYLEDCRKDQLICTNQFIFVGKPFTKEICQTMHLFPYNFFTVFFNGKIVQPISFCFIFNL